MRTTETSASEPDPVPERGRAFPSHRSRRKASDETPSGSRDGGKRASRWGRWSALLGVTAGVVAVAQSGVLAQTSTSGASAVSRPIWGSMAIVVVLVLANGMFAMAEAALLSVRRTRVDQLAEEGNQRALVVKQLLSQPTRMLSTLQVGATLVSLFSAGAAADSMVEPLGSFLRSRFAGTFLMPHVGWIAFVTVLLAVSLLTLVVGEIAPKSIAVRFAEPISLAVAYPLRWLQHSTTPVVCAVTWLSGIFVRPFGVSAQFHSTVMSEDELKMMVEQSEEYGVIETQEKEMIHSIFDLGDTRVSQVMTPRLDITAIEADASFEELVQVVTASGHSRLPVYDDNLDNIVGVVHAKDVLQGITGTAHATCIRDLMRQATFIPDSKRVDDLLTEFRRHHQHLAIVRDEYGTVTGVVTIEDILEEIVGEIQDEYDREDPPVRQIDECTVSVDARMSIADFNERMGVELSEEEADTVGGFVFGLLGHQPRQGEKAVWDALEFTVEATDGRRVQRVTVRKVEPEVEGESDTPEQESGETSDADRPSEQ